MELWQGTDLALQKTDVPVRFSLPGVLNQLFCSVLNFSSEKKKMKGSEIGED